MRDSQNERDGAYADICPAVFEKGFLGTAAWGDAGLTIPYRLWLMYGDKEIIARHYDSMEDYMAFIDKTYGLDGARAGYADWLAYEDTDKLYVSVCYHYNNAVLMQKFSNIFFTWVISIVCVCIIFHPPISKLIIYYFFDYVNIFILLFLRFLPLFLRLL